MARLDPNTALKLSEPVEEAYLACVDRLIINIARHLGKGTAIRTAGWETRMLAELGQLSAENARIINEATKRVPQKILASLSEASRIALEDIDKAVKKAIENGDIEKAPTDRMQGMIDSLAEQAVEQANLVNTVMLDSGQSAYIQAVNNTAIWVNQELDKQLAQGIMNEAAMASTSTTETRRQALKKAISQMADNGIYGFVDRAGRHWSPEAYINMDIRTTAHNAAIQSIRTRQEDYGSDIFQISSHPGARPLCYPYQGKFYSWGGGSGTFVDGMGVRHPYKSIQDTSYGQPAGIFGINCGHYPLPQIPRVTIPQDRPEQDKEDNDREYLMSQQQRALERDVRNAKRRAAAFDAAGLRDAFSEESVRVREKRQAYRDFCQKTGRRERLDRLGVAGYTRSVSQKATKIQKSSETRSLKVEEIRKRIGSDQTLKIIHQGNQNKHILASKGYLPGRSYLYGDLHTAQEIVNRYAGTGEIRLTKKNENWEWNHKEFVELPQDIGVYINSHTGEKFPTNVVSIHYGKKGTHLVPARRKDR